VRIEYHNPEHREQPGRRIGVLVNSGSTLEVVLAEIARCEALCVRCHRQKDARRRFGA
jgi:hypothetical protein